MAWRRSATTSWWRSSSARVRVAVDALTVANDVLAAHGGVHALARCSCRRCWRGRRHRTGAGGADRRGDRTGTPDAGDSRRRTASRIQCSRCGATVAATVRFARRRTVRDRPARHAASGAAHRGDRERHDEHLGRRAAGSVPGGGARRRVGDRGVPQPPFRRSHAQSGRRGVDAAAGGGGSADGYRSWWITSFSATAVLQLEGVTAKL